MAGIPPEYNTVPERLAEFKAQYPEGSFQPAYPDRPWELLTVESSDGPITFVAYAAAAYRTPDDPKPGIGVAWERVPGLTNFTRNSELQNAETSAWGRAIVAVQAADAKKGIATADEIRNRQAEGDPSQHVTSSGGKVCSVCTTSLAGAPVERDGEGGWKHKGSCPVGPS
jgi:hypothetical protein